jgi:signal peptidase I
MKLFEKAGIPGWKSLVPGLGALEWCKMIGRKPTYALLLLVPIVNFFIYAGMVIDLIRSFGRHSLAEAYLVVIFAPISFFRIGRDKNCTYQGPILEKERAYHRLMSEAQASKDKAAIRKLEAEYAYLKKSSFREWNDAIVFAVFAAAFIRMFLIEAFVIPTSSMEGSLKVGDFLFVSKMHYGIRTPMTVAQVPLLHNRTPILEGESYLEKPTLPYYRLPAIESIDHNEPVVFNFPAGDSIVITPERNFDVYQLRQMNGGQLAPGTEVITRPIDKKDHYIKRCIGLPGDSLEIKNGVVFINGKTAPVPTHRQFLYQVSGTTLNYKKLENWGVSLNDAGKNAAQSGYFMLDDAQVAKIKAIGNDVKVERVPQQKLPGYVFPNDAKRFSAWTVDDYGPIYIPKKGVTTPLNADNIAFYVRIIRDFEHNTLKINGDRIFINGKESNSYTFKQNYFWMMGDNRHNSEDSRIWGYVPEDHVVGKPLFIWFSTKNGNMRNGINWNRIFKSANTL